MLPLGMAILLSIGLFHVGGHVWECFLHFSLSVIRGLLFQVFRSYLILSRAISSNLCLYIWTLLLSYQGHMATAW